MHSGMETRTIIVHKQLVQANHAFVVDLGQDPGTRPRIGHTFVANDDTQFLVVQLHEGIFCGA